MRLSILLASLLSFFIYSCTKTGTGTTQPPPPPPGGSGSSSGLTITSVSPLFPYPGDEVTITGTGFDADLTKDTVVFGKSDKTGFSDIYFVTNFRQKIISATTTQIKFVTDSQFMLPPSTDSVAIRVSAPLKSAFTANNFSLKRFLTFGFTSNDYSPYIGTCPATYAGDSVYLTGEGFYPPFTVTINGQQTNIALDANSTTSARGFLPVTFFGGSRPVLCGDNKELAVKATNGDGKTFSNIRTFFEAPNSVLNVPFSLGLSYSLSHTNVAHIDLTGYALRDDYTMQLTGTDNANNQTFTETIAIPVGSGYPNQSSFDIDLGAFPKPSSPQGTTVNYMTFIAGNTHYGFGTAFTIFP